MRISDTPFIVRSVALALLLHGAFVADVAAQPAKRAKPAAPKKAPKPAPPKTDVASQVTKLESGDEAQVRSALDELRLAGPSAASAAPVVAELLAKGLNEPLTVQAIETLGDLESESGSAVLGRYATHRVVRIRRAAVRSLRQTKGSVAAQALRRALGDADAQVRSNAAAGLGSLKAKDAVPDLLLALEHKVNEAAASLGQLCSGDQCADLAGKLGKLPFDVVTSGLDPILFRPSAEVSDETKIKILGKLRELGTAEANKFLRDVEKRLPKDASARLREAVDQAVKATTGGSQ